MKGSMRFLPAEKPANSFSMDVNEFPEACKLTGLHEVRNGKLYLSLKQICGKDAKTIVLEGTTKEELRKGGLESLK